MSDNKYPMSWINCPEIDQELLDYLAQVFPDKLPEIDITDRELGAKVGSQEVIRHLSAVRAQQKDIELEDVLKQT